MRGLNTGRSGVIYPPEAAIPEEGELIGDKRPGYETMSVYDKCLSWWTRKQLKIFNDTVLKEVGSGNKDLMGSLPQ